MRILPQTFVVLVACFGLTVSAQPKYQFTDLGTPGQHFTELSAQINNRGTLGIAASEPNPDPEDMFFNPDRGFVYRDGNYIEIVHPYEPPEPDLRGPGYIVSDINDLDLAVGHFLWGPDSTTSFLFDAQDAHFTELQLRGVWVYDFANNGFLLGGSLADIDWPVVYHVFTHEKIELNDVLGDGAYTSLIQMNNFGLVHGDQLDPVSREFLYQIGSGQLTFGDFDGLLTDLGTFVKLPDGAVTAPIASNPFDEHGRLNANDWGVIVGATDIITPRAFVYDGSTVHDLNALVPPAVGVVWTLERATDVNDLGQIVGTMRNSAGDIRLFMMSPSDVAVSDGEWDAVGLASQSGTFALTYDAVPMANNLDGVTGLSLTPAEAYTDLAAIVRFNTNGRIDARRGNYYRAENVLNYKPGVPYRVELTVNLTTRRYSATVTPAGGSPVVIARDYAFRTEMSQATQLNALNVLSTGGAVSVGNIKLSSGTSGPLTSTGGKWVNAPVPPQTSTFTVRFRVTPGSRPIDGVVGLSRGAADEANDLATTLRFNTGGRVDARNGSRYSSVRSFKYSAGVSYEVVMTVNVATHRYSATIAAPGQSPVTIANNYAFRGSQGSVQRLDRFNVRSSGGSLSVENLRLQ